MPADTVSSPIESALVVLIPEAEFLVKRFREQYDPAEALGVPAHITVLYPFQPPPMTTEAKQILATLFAGLPCFTTTFAETRRFPEVLYLAPSPDAPLRALIDAIVARFPDTPPYGGQFAEVIPHLTIAQVSDPQKLQTINDDFQRAAQGHLPFTAHVAEVALMDNARGRWEVREKFGLGGR